MMTRLRFCSFLWLAVLLVSGLFLSLDSKSTVWETSILKSLESAKKHDRIVFVELYADWCTYCKQMERDVFPDTDVQKKIESMIPVRLNGEEFPNLMDRYGLKGFPSLLYLDKDAKLIHKETGFMTKAMLLESFRIATEKFDSEKQALVELQKNPNSIPLLYKLGVRAYGMGELEEAETYFSQITKSPSKEEPKKKKDALFNLGLISMDKANFEKAKSIWSDYLRLYPEDTADRASVYFFRGISSKESGQLAQAEQDFQQALTLTKDKNEKNQIQKELNSLQTSKPN